MTTTPSPSILHKSLNQLASAISDCDRSIRFACEGSIERRHGAYVRSGTHYGDFTSGDAEVRCAPITIRWGQQKGSGKVLTFDDAPFYQKFGNTLHDLVQDCRPATFAFDGKDVFDERVRKARGMAATEFSTNFNPYDYGIVQQVGEKLTPFLAKAGQQPVLEHWGVVAELYKLNIYSGPSDMFKAHIDTPRGRTQFGSLVVCLPTDFEGGQLTVSHGGRSQSFDLKHDRSTLKWAAFYSDCEHEILPITVGNRVTLTYQLYIASFNGGINQCRLNALTPEEESLKQRVQKMLNVPEIRSQGIILGFHGVYRYPWSFEGTYEYDKKSRLLKGVDGLLFTIIRGMGLTVYIKPVRDVHRPNGEVTSPIAADIATFDGKDYAGDEIFAATTWVNGWKTQDEHQIHYETASTITQWIGNETEIEWEYTSIALLAVASSKDKRENIPRPTGT